MATQIIEIALARFTLFIRIMFSIFFHLLFFPCCRNLPVAKDSPVETPFERMGVVHFASACVRARGQMDDSQWSAKTRIQNLTQSNPRNGIHYSLPSNPGKRSLYSLPSHSLQGSPIQNSKGYMEIPLHSQRVHHSIPSHSLQGSPIQNGKGHANASQDSSRDRIPSNPGSGTHYLTPSHSGQSYPIHFPSSTSTEKNKYSTASDTIGTLTPPTGPECFFAIVSHFSRDFPPEKLFYI